MFAQPNMISVFVFILMMIYFVALFFWAKKFISAQEKLLEMELNSFSQLLLRFQDQKNSLVNEKRRVEEEARNIYALYELTKEITKSTNEKESWDIFSTMLHKYVQFDSCAILPEPPKTDDPLNGGRTFVFPLISKRRRMGYLAVKNCPEAEREKISVLGHQYALALRRIRLYQDIERIAITDGLTEVFTRRYFEERFEEEIKRSQRRNIHIALLMIDVDHFKKINDEHSHLTGDRVLRLIADLIKENIRGIDIAGRYGGEEFSVILPDTDQEGALYAAERIRRSVEEAVIRAYDAELKATVSIGVATFPKDGKKMEDLIDHADQALYQAKREGRNRTVVFASKNKK